jgi:hypothetical protein
MAAFVSGWGITIAAVAVISVVFVVAAYSLSREFRYVRALTDYLGVELANVSANAESTRRPDLDVQGIREEAVAIIAARDPAWAQRQVRGWQMRAQRLEAALAFWVDLLRQLGLLGTVVGLGLAFAVETPDDLLQALALKVWTTVCGLAYSIFLSALFGIKMAVWADTCEKNIEAWDERRRRGVSS